LQQRIDKENEDIKDGTSEVLSATYQPFIPGSIYVEAPSELHVRLACSQLHGVIGNRGFELVSIEDATAILTCGAGHQSLETGSWVRIRRGLYKDDLAFIRGIPTTLSNWTAATINVIPRISLDKKGKKRKRAQVVTDRPEAAFFNRHNYDETEVERINLDKGGKRQEDMWKFRGSIYQNGLREMDIVVTGLNFKKVDPTQDELKKWLDCSDEDVALAAKNALAASQSERRAIGIRPGDRVEIKKGWAQGRKGKVRDIEGGEVLVDISDTSLPPVTVPITDVQKYFVVGDLVCIMSGPHAGAHGWCVKIEYDAVLLSEYGTNVEVSVLHMLFLPRLNVDFTRYGRHQDDYSLNKRISCLLSNPMYLVGSHESVRISLDPSPSSLVLLVFLIGWTCGEACPS
jgi:transcription elongation factor SPT5